MKSCAILTLPLLAAIGCATQPLPNGDPNGGAGSAQVCDGVAPPSGNGPVDLTPGSTDDARALASLRCAPPAADGDLTIDIDQTAFESGLFVASVHQTQPTRFDGAYCVTMQFSGDWGWQVHDRASSAGAYDYLIEMLIGIEMQADSPGTVAVSAVRGGQPVVINQRLHCSALRN